MHSPGIYYQLAYISTFATTTIYYGSKEAVSSHVEVEGGWVSFMKLGQK